MVVEDKRTIRIMPTADDFHEGRRFIVALLKKRRIPKPAISETLLVLEALFHEIGEQGFGEEDGIEIAVRNRFGETLIDIRFEGRLFFLGKEDEEFSPEKKILDGYGDKIDFSYYSRVNRILLTVVRRGSNILYLSILAVLLAAAVYTLILKFSNETGMILLKESVIEPLETVFTNAMLMVGAPVTFLSLLNNLTDTYLVTAGNSEARSLQRKMFLTSGLTVFLGIVVSILISANITTEGGYLVDYTSKNISVRIAELIESLVPPDIFSPFIKTSPFPIIILAGLVTYAFCSSGKYFNSLKKAVRIAYVLFSRMLGAVMYALPVFFFISTLDLFVENGYEAFYVFPNIAMLALISMPPLIIMYLLMLGAGGVKIKPFLAGYGPLIRENIGINSPIDAVPFNVRYCARVYNMDRKRLEESLPVLAQINLDGNCYIITLVSVLVLLQNGHGASWFEVVMIGLLVFVLSLGAPNQPGSCLIGFVIVLNYLNAYTMLPFAIIAEVVFGRLLNIINVTGDIVTAAVEDSQAKKAEAGQSA